MHSVLFLLILTVLSTVSTFHFTYQTNALSAPLSAFLPSFVAVTTYTDESTNKLGKGAGSTLRRFDVSNIFLFLYNFISDDNADRVSNVSKCSLVLHSCCRILSTASTRILSRILSTASTFHFSLSAWPMYSRPTPRPTHPFLKDTFLCTAGMNPLSKVQPYPYFTAVWHDVGMIYD